MKSILIPLLVAIAEATSPASYIEAQDKALVSAQGHYEELLLEAASNSESAIRIEALGLIELLGRPDAEAMLLKSMNEDEDATVAEHAKALLYRATVAKSVRESGRMSDNQYEKYRITTRKFAAEALFGRSTSTHDTKQ
jgi:hypothetical protein